MSLTARLHRLVTDRVDPRPLALVRIGIGIAALLRAWEAATILPRVLAPGMLRFTYAEWIPQPGMDAVPWLLGIWVLLAAAFTVGWWSRAAGLALAGLMTWVLLLDEQTYGNHLYLLILLVVLLVAADAGAARSVDARRRGETHAVPLWPVRLLQLQLTIVYGFAALAKINPLYLSGAVLAADLRHGVTAALPAWLTAFPMVAVLAGGAILVEVLLALGLWSRRWRGPVALLGVAFHLMLIVTVIEPLQLVIFTLEMISLYSLFFARSHGDPVSSGYNASPIASPFGEGERGTLSVHAAGLTRLRS